MDVVMSALGHLVNVQSLIFIILGVFIGILFGAIPGMSANLGVTVFLPFTFVLGTVPALLLLCGIFYGANFGGSISAILINTPGTNGACATLLDGYPLAQKGHALKALDMALVASTFGGLVSALSLLFFSQPISMVAMQFGAPEYFALALFGLSIIASVSGKSILKGLVSGCLGMLLASVGIDSVSGISRFTFGNITMFKGINMIAVLLGVYAIAQMIARINGTEEVFEAGTLQTNGGKSDRLTRKEAASMVPTMAKSSIIGTIIGAIPGTGSAIAAYLSYNEAKRTAKPDEHFGEGELRGIAAPESGNNGATASCLIPLLTLGIPGDAVAATLMGAFTMHGLVVGPKLFETSGPLVYAIMIGSVIAQIVMFLQGRYLMPLFVKITHIPQNLLTALLMVVCCAGAFAIANSAFEVYIMLTFGVVAYFMNKFGFPAVPIVLGMVLGPIAESNMRNALAMSNGSWTIFVQRPICLAFIILAIVLIVLLKRANKKNGLA